MAKLHRVRAATRQAYLRAAARESAQRYSLRKGSEYVQRPDGCTPFVFNTYEQALDAQRTHGGEIVPALTIARIHPRHRVSPDTYNNPTHRVKITAPKP